MTKDEALKLALKALELAQDNLRDHGDNCFLHDEGEYNRCFCGKDSLSDHLQSVVKKLDEALAQPKEQETDIWVLTSEYNDYDQHGEYFEAVFIGKPTSEQIQKHCGINEEGAVHILSGGGRVKNEYLWYNLQKTQAAHGIKENT